MLSHSKRKLTVRGATLLLILGVTLLLFGSAAAPHPQAPAVQPESDLPELQGGGTTLVVEGRLLPHQYVALSTAANGQVTGLFVHEGEIVEAGTVILRLGDREQLTADLAAADFELLSAQQALDQLDDSAGVELALSKKALAEAQKTLAFAESKVKSLKKTTPQKRIDQAHANMLLAERSLDRLIDDYDRWQKKAGNKNNILWKFINQRKFRFLITDLEKRIAIAERRYQDSIEKYEDLKKPVDAVDLAIAESDLAVAQADVDEAQRLVTTLSNGPDPDLVAAAQARLTLTEAALLAAKTAQADSELVAPMTGKVVDLNIKSGEWAETGNPVVVIADNSTWSVETDDLTEIEVTQVYEGQPVVVTPDALPSLKLSGVVEAIKDISEEKRGDVTYTVTIHMDENDPRLRWGMTVSVFFEE